MENLRKAQRTKRKRRIRARIKGTAQRPRLVVFRSNRHFLLQLVDDEKRHTLAAASDRELGTKKQKGATDAAFALGALIAQKAKKLGIEKVVFDRGGYAYEGKIAAIAKGAREEGLKF